MFELIVKKITNTVRNVVRTVGAVANRSQWTVPAAILALFLFV